MVHESRKKLQILTNLEPEFIANIIDLEKWLDIIKKRKATSAPGIDEISYEIIKHLDCDAAKKLIYQLHQIYKKGYLPDHLKIIKTIAI